MSLSAYYPYGEPTVEPKGQRFLFGGKEREHAGGRNAYDFGARSLTPFGSWSSPDPKAEDFYQISPFSYCAGDPINKIDPDGETVYTISVYGELLDMTDFASDKDMIVILNRKGEQISSQIEFRANTILNCMSVIDKHAEKGVLLFVVKGDDNAKTVFEFLAENITAINGIEIGLNLMDKDEINSQNDIFVGKKAKLKGSHSVFENRLNERRTYREFIHSHKKNEKASDADKETAFFYEKILERRQKYKPRFYTYVYPNLYTRYYSNE